MSFKKKDECTSFPNFDNKIDDWLILFSFISCLLIDTINQVIVLYF